MGEGANTNLALHLIQDSASPISSPFDAVPSPPSDSMNNTISRPTMIKIQDKRQQQSRENHDREHQEQITSGGQGRRQSDESSKVNRKGEQAPTAEK